MIDPLGAIASEFSPHYPTQTRDVSYGLTATGLEAFFNHPTPGAVNDDASVVTRGVVVSEVMYHPASELVSEEYIEIYNGEAASIDLTGWELSGAVDFVLPAATLAPGEYVVVAADPLAFAAKYPGVSNVVGGWTGKLSNKSDSIQLLDDAGRLVDGVTYYDEGQWTAREVGPLDRNHMGWVWSDAHDGGGKSLELVSFGLSNDWGQQWQASSVVGGTPGAVNSTADADGDVAPLILNVTQLPIIPQSTDPVTIAARLVDELSGGLSATLHWRVDGAASFTIAAMNDAGTGGDTLAGDSVFAAQVPALPSGTVVEYYIESADQAGNLRTFPSPTEPSGQQLANLLYQVDDSFNPAALPGVNDQPVYRLIMTEAERAELVQIGSSSSDRESHARMNGTLVIVTAAGVEARYQVGIRNRGLTSSNKLPNSYHIDLPRDASWETLDALNFNTQYTQSQLAGLQLFQAAGFVAEDSRAVQVRVNGVDLSNPGSPSFGVYIQLEASDDVFVTNHFPEDDGGNLYRAVRSSSGSARGDLRDLGSDPAAYTPYYDKKTNASEADYSDLIELVDVLNNSSDAEYYGKLQQVVDIDQWLGYFATVTILGSQETMLGTGVGDDYLLYRGELDPRFMLIPHDMDTILGQGDTTGSPTSGLYRAAEIPTLERFLMHPEILPAYHAKLKQLLETTFAKPAFDALLDAKLTEFTPSSIIASMKAFMDARREFILETVAAPLTAVAHLTTAGGVPRTTQGVVALSGEAPLAGVQSVVAEGVAAQYDPVTGQWMVGESTGGVPATFITTGATWHYLDAGQVPSTTPGADWRVDDPGWTSSGPSQLGYGDGDEATVVSYIDTDPNQSGTQKNITTYFRKAFNVTDAAEVSTLSMRLLRDDGAIVFLNGAEVARSNLPTGPIGPTTAALQNINGSAEDLFHTFDIDPLLLVEGENVIAVEVHQDLSSSSDISFDFELTGVIGNPITTGGLPLLAGINRIEVQAYAGLAGTGALLDSTFIDVWYDDGASQNVSGDITSPTLWTAAAGPYVVTGDIVVVGAGALTIEPGTTVFFNPGTGLTVRDGGQVVAEGTPQARIRLAFNPVGGATQWEGLRFANTAADNRLTYIDMQGGDGAGQAVRVDQARVIFDHASWFGIDDQVFDLTHPSMTVSNSHIPAIGGNETIHLFGLDQGEHLVFENNVIGFNSSGDDVVDLGHDTLTPPTIVFRGNEFQGGFDDGIDTDGFPVLIENNYFHDFHLNTSRPTTSNAVSSGHMTASGQTVSSDLRLRGNVFINNDHHVLLKDFSFAVLENNTFLDATLGAIQFTEAGGTSVIGPGLGADIDGDIFWGASDPFLHTSPHTQLTVNRSIVPANLVGLGVGNLSADPLLVDPAMGDYRLQRGSPALGAGPLGTDIGAVQASRLTPASSANLRVTELHYHPQLSNKAGGEVGGDADEFEFIELQNVGAEAIDLSDVQFTNGIRYAFAWQASLAAGEVIVLASNLDLFHSRYGENPAAVGEFSGNLSNKGESVRLEGAGGAIIANFAFDDALPWPTAADGSGPSMEMVNPLGDPNSPANWRASLADGGTPSLVTLAPVRLPGDYDGNLTVEQADYLVWKASYGMSVAPDTGADGNADGVVDAADYSVWRDNLGATAAPASVVAAPQALAAAKIVAATTTGEASIGATTTYEVTTDEATGEQATTPQAYWQASLSASDPVSVPGTRRLAASRAARQEAFAVGEPLTARAQLLISLLERETGREQRAAHRSGSEPLSRETQSDERAGNPWDQAFEAFEAVFGQPLFRR